MTSPKKPQDHKSAEYVWTTPDGEKVTLKPFERLPSGLFRNAKNMTDLDATFALIEAATDEAGLAVVDALPLEELEGLFSDWSTNSGTSLPQS